MRGGATIARYGDPRLSSAGLDASVFPTAAAARADRGLVAASRMARLVDTYLMRFLEISLWHFMNDLTKKVIVQKIVSAFNFIVYILSKK